MLLFVKRIRGLLSQATTDFARFNYVVPLPRLQTVYITFLSERRSDMNVVALIIQLICGALGGNITGKLLKAIDLGPLGNSIAGIVGGGLGGQILNALGLFTGAPGGSLDLASIIGNIASGGVGGGVLMAIIGLIKSLMAAGNQRNLR
jgi:hypothetical protein